MSGLEAVLRSKAGDYVSPPNAALSAAARQSLLDLWRDVRGAVGERGRGRGRSAGPLYVEGFDAEQIWTQLEMNAAPLLRSIETRCDELAASSEGAAGDASDDDEVASDDGSDEMRSEGEPSSSSPSLDAVESPQWSDDEDDDADPVGGDGDGDGRGELLPTEEGFFRLDQMEDFVQQAEKAFEEEMQRAGDDASESDDEDGDDDDDDARAAKDAMYADFFGDPEPSRRGAAAKATGSEDEEGEAPETKRVRFAPDVAGAVEPAEPSDGGALAVRDESKSLAEVRSERMQAKISKLEAANMAEAHWSMRGEIGAAGRPENSLLEVDLDFQSTINPPLEPTEEMANEIEDIIRARIIEERYDDVIRVVAPDASKEARVMEEAELNDKKSIRGLAEIYERDYMQARGFSDIEDKQNKQREACWTLYRSIAARLDALSHFEFAPKPVAESAPDTKPEVPAIAMEEVGLEAISTAGTAAPGEVQAKAKGMQRAEGEMEKEDRKRRRRAKKRKHRAAEQGDKNEGAPTAVAGRKSDKAMAKTKKKKGDAGEVSGNRVRYGKSSEVFQRLQEERESAKPSS